MLFRNGRSRATLLATVLLASAVSAQTAPPVLARPTPGPAKPYAFPKVTTVILPNGLRLAVVENHAVPVVAVRIGLPPGALLDAPGKDGGWVLMLNSIREGTVTRSAAEIADAAADLGTNVSLPTAGFPNAALGFTTARSMWQQALELLADMLEHPSFPADGVNRAQGVLASAASQSSAGVKAVRQLNVQLYGPTHPNGRFMTDSSVRRVTRDDVVALHSAYLRPENATIVVAGDVTPAAARAAVEKAFGGWEKGGTTVDWNVPAPNAIGQTTIYLVDQPNLPQSYVLTGQLVPSRNNPDAPALEIADATLGGQTGSAGSRLVSTFRTQRGLTYTSTTALLWRPEPQPATWRAAISVGQAVTDTAVIEWLRIIRDLRGTRPLTAEELAFTRQNLIGRLQLTLESSVIANRTLDVLQNHLPETFYTDYVRRMATVTLPEVQAAASRYFDADHLVIVIVGDRAKIEAPLRATGIPVVIVDH